MTRHPHAIVVALLLLPAAALAQDTYRIHGAGVSGTATVTKGPGDPMAPVTPISADIVLQRFGPNPSTRTIHATGLELPNGRLELNYDAPLVGPTARRGAIDHLLGTGGGATSSTTERVKTQLVPAGEGYRGTVDGVEQTWTPASAQPLVVIMVPGLSTNYWNRFSLPYFNENRDTIRAMGIEAYRIGTHADDSIDTDHAFATENSVAQNAAVIAEEIRTQAAFGKRVIVFAHSKGATDATAAIATHPDLVQHVAGLIAIQPVYGGSPVADLAASNWLTLAGVKMAFEAWAGGSRDAVVDLSRKRRAEFVAANPFPSDKIPTVVIRSSFDRSKFRIGRTANGERLTNPGKRFFQRVLRMNQSLIEQFTDEPSDGMVTLDDQVIPGATIIDKDDLDHFEPGLTMMSRHTPAKLTTEAMGALLAKIAR